MGCCTIHPHGKGKITDVYCSFAAEATELQMQKVFDRVQDLEAAVTPQGNDDDDSSRRSASSAGTHGLAAGITPQVQVAQSVTVDSVIRGADGEVICTFGELLRERRALAQEILEVKAQIDANGGVVFRGLQPGRVHRRFGF